MTPMAQPDLHPDADLLNAFVERALPEAERAGIVAHMAGCARCREVVYLAQAAAEPEMAPAVALKAEAQPGWFSAAFAKWRFALIPAAALAAVAAVVLWVQIHPRPPEEMAQLAPQPAPSPSRTLPAPGNHVGREAPPTARPETNKAPVRSSGVVALNQLTHRDLTQIDAAAAPALAAPVVEGRAIGGLHRDGRSASMARYGPPVQPFRPPAVVTFPSPPASPDVEQRQFAPTAAPAAAPAPAPPNIVAVRGPVPEPASPVGGPLLAAQSPRVELAPQPMNGLAGLQLARHARLPSGKNAVSSAALLNRMVAVDSAGSLFLSQDGGKHWDSVRTQWSGKAVEVEALQQGFYRIGTNAAVSGPEMAVGPAQTPESSAAIEGANASAATKTKAAPRVAAERAAAASGMVPPVPANRPAPAVLFRLVTDRRQVWISADGKTWREQQ